jgi:DNA-binding NtrC family response regulator
MENPHHATILIVEDDPTIRSLLYEQLTGHGYTVLPAHDAKSAQEIARAHAEEIDLVITDMMLPGGNGKRVARDVGALKPEVKVIYISGYIASAATVDHNIRFLSKPFRMADLFCSVSELLAMPAKSA